MLKCFAKKGTAVNKCNTTKNNHPFKHARTKSFFHVFDLSIASLPGFSGLSFDELRELEDAIKAVREPGGVGVLEGEPAVTVVRRHANHLPIHQVG